MRMVIQNPLELPWIKELLFQPSQPDLVHPLHPKLALLLCHVLSEQATALVMGSRQTV